MPELRSAAVYGVGETMVKGEADIALHQIPELMAVSRIEIVGPLPRDLHSITAFSPAVLATSKEAEVAKTLVEKSTPRRRRRSCCRASTSPPTSPGWPAPTW